MLDMTAKVIRSARQNNNKSFYYIYELLNVVVAFLHLIL